MPTLNTVEHLWDKQRKAHEGPTSLLKGLKGSAVDISASDTRGHLQRSGGVHASTGLS